MKNDDQKRAEEFCRKMTGTNRATEVESALLQPAAQRETEQKRKEDTLANKVGKAPGPQRGGKLPYGS